MSFSYSIHKWEWKGKCVNIKIWSPIATALTTIFTGLGLFRLMNKYTKISVFHIGFIIGWWQPQKGLFLWRVRQSRWFSIITFFLSSSKTEPQMFQLSCFLEEKLLALDSNYNFVILENVTVAKRNMRNLRHSMWELLLRKSLWFTIPVNFSWQKTHIIAPERILLSERQPRVSGCAEIFLMAETYFCKKNKQKQTGNPNIFAE